MSHTVDTPPIHTDIHTTRVVLCHFGELMLKGANRHLFITQLGRNLRVALRGYSISALRQVENRFLIEFADDYAWEPLAAVLRKVIGIANAYPVMVVAPTMDAILAATAQIIERCMARGGFASFAVECRRIDKFFPLRSRDICIQLGSAIARQTGARVNLDHPERKVWVQIWGDRALLAIDAVQGVGGLPVGTSGRVLTLLSGGIDSPVAAWRMMRRGCTVFAAHFHSYPFTPAEATEKIERLARVLATWHAGALQLATIPFGDAQQVIVAKAPDALRVVLYRRLMLRVATKLAWKKRAHAVVTGDALAQVASQTLSNLVTIEDAAGVPVLRPLVGMDKDEIVRSARQAGTYDISIEAHQDCCQFMEPHHPATHSNITALRAAEAALDIDQLVANIVAGVTWQRIQGGA